MELTRFVMKLIIWKTLFNIAEAQFQTPELYNDVQMKE